MKCIQNIFMYIFSFSFDCCYNFLLYSTDWSLIKSVNDKVSFLEYSNWIPAFSSNSEIPSPPNLVGSDSRTLSPFEQMRPPIIDGMNYLFQWNQTVFYTWYCSHVVCRFSFKYTNKGWISWLRFRLCNFW